jgi:hypothetical protein
MSTMVMRTRHSVNFNYILRLVFILPSKRTVKLHEAELSLLKTTSRERHASSSVANGPLICGNGQHMNTN